MTYKDFDHQEISLFYICYYLAGLFYFCYYPAELFYFNIIKFLVNVSLYTDILNYISVLLSYKNTNTTKYVNNWKQNMCISDDVYLIWKKVLITRKCDILWLGGVL